MTKSDTEQVGARVDVAPRIEPTSWLIADQYEDFRAGYRYAATQTLAIPALARCAPEEMYHAFVAIQRGIARQSVSREENPR